MHVNTDTVIGTSWPTQSHSDFKHKQNFHWEKPSACQKTERKTNLLSSLWARSATILLINKCEYLMPFLSVNSLLCFLKNILALLPFSHIIFQRHFGTICVHHVNMLYCKVCYTFPYLQAERPHPHIDYMINTMASVCHRSSEEKTDRRSISTPPSIPSVGIGFS